MGQEVEVFGYNKTAKGKVTDIEMFHQILEEASDGDQMGLLARLGASICQPCKILEPYDNSFWGFEKRWQEEKKKIKIPKIVAYLSLLLWSHALLSDQY